MDRGSRLLVVASGVCRYDKASGDLRFLRVIEALAEFAVIDLLLPSPEPSASDPEQKYWEALRDRGVHFLDPLLYSPCPSRLLSSRACYDWVLFEFWHEAERFRFAIDLFRFRCPAVRIAIDTVDVHYLREVAAHQAGSTCYGDYQEIKARKARELASYRLADLVLVVSADDEEALAVEGINSDKALIPNIVSVVERPRGQRGNELLFVGGFRHLPNVHAVCWFVAEIFPRLRQLVPDVCLNIVGSDPSQEVIQLGEVPGVRVVGFVDDMSAWLEAAAVSVAPLQFGAGMKGKVTEALSFGVPVVTTSVGAQGLGAKSGVHLMIADRAEDFVDAVVYCLRHQDAAEKMGRQGQALVEALCGMTSVRSRLQSVFLAVPPTDVSQAEGRLAGSRSVRWLRYHAWVLLCNVKSFGALKSAVIRRRIAGRLKKIVGRVGRSR